MCCVHRCQLKEKREKRPEHWMIHPHERSFLSWERASEHMSIWQIRIYSHHAYCAFHSHRNAGPSNGHKDEMWPMRARVSITICNSVFLFNFLRLELLRMLRPFVLIKNIRNWIQLNRTRTLHKFNKNRHMIHFFSIDIISVVF